MRFIRATLKAAILLAAYIVALAFYVFPWIGLPVGIAVLYGLARKRTEYSAYGNARWATSRDIQHMLDGGDR